MIGIGIGLSCWLFLLQLAILKPSQYLLLSHKYAFFLVINSNMLVFHEEIKHLFFYIAPELKQDLDVVDTVSPIVLDSC